MSSLRDRQIREVLDEDMNINRRVFDIAKDQVRVFDETVAPKKTRDIEAELSVDKLVEQINKIVEKKVVSIESLLSQIVRSNRIDQRAYESVIENGDIITAYNQLIRVYKTTGISRNSQEVIKVKFQEIQANINAIMFGLDELIRYLFSSGKSNKEIFQLVRTQAVYNVIDKQLYRSNSYRPIEQGDLTVSIREMLGKLSEVQRAKLEEISKGDVSERSLLSIPVEQQNEERKIRALESELGVPLPRQLLAEFGGEEKEQAVSEFAEFNKEKLVRTEQQMSDVLQDYEVEKTQRINQLKQEKRDVRVLYRQQQGLKAQSEQLMRAQRYFDEDDDKADDRFVREVPLERDINVKQEQIEEKIQTIQRLEAEVREIETDIRDLRVGYQQLKARMMGQMATSGLQGQVSRARKRTVFKEPVAVAAEEKEAEEEPFVAPAPVRKVPSSIRANFYTKQFLQDQQFDELLKIGEDLNYFPRRETSKETIIKSILQKQKQIPEAERRIIGMGKDEESYGRARPTERDRLEDLVRPDRPRYREEELEGSGMDYLDDRNDMYKIHRRMKL
jgi:hypothetical protein